MCDNSQWESITSYQYPFRVYQWVDHMFELVKVQEPAAVLEYAEDHFKEVGGVLGHAVALERRLDQVMDADEE